MGGREIWSEGREGGRMKGGEERGREGRKGGERKE